MNRVPALSAPELSAIHDHLPRPVVGDVADTADVIPLDHSLHLAGLALLCQFEQVAWTALDLAWPSVVEYAWVH